MWISELLARLDNVDLETAIDRGIEATKEDYADLNRKQWSEGITKDGEPIEPNPYSPAYARKRTRAGLQTEFIDLRFKGNLYGGFAVNPDGPVIRLGSEVEYEQYVSRRYPGIYGLTEENMRRYREIVRPYIVETIREQIYG